MGCARVERVHVWGNTSWPCTCQVCTKSDVHVWGVHVCQLCTYRGVHVSRVSCAHVSGVHVWGEHVSGVHMSAAHMSDADMPAVHVWGRARVGRARAHTHSPAGGTPRRPPAAPCR